MQHQRCIVIIVVLVVDDACHSLELFIWRLIRLNNPLLLDRPVLVRHLFELLGGVVKRSLAIRGWMWTSLLACTHWLMCTVVDGLGLRLVSV